MAYDEIADAVGKSPAAVRQIAHRARAHIAARRLFHVGAESITWPCSASWSGAAGDRLPRAREETS